MVLFRCSDWPLKSRVWPTPNQAKSHKFWHEFFSCLGRTTFTLKSKRAQVYSDLVGFVYMPEKSPIHLWNSQCSTDFLWPKCAPEFATSVGPKIIKINWGPFFVIFRWKKCIHHMKVNSILQISQLFAVFYYLFSIFMPFSMFHFVDYITRSFENIF